MNLLLTFLKRTWIFLVIVALWHGGAASGQILPPGATPKLLATNFIFTESPLYDGNGGVYFSDLNSDHINSHLYRYDLTTKVATQVDPLSGGANGTYFSPLNHQMITADRDRQQISLRSASNVGVVQTVLTSGYLGVKYNGPNDLVVDSAGGIYFSDPDYENRASWPEAFYYRSPAGVVKQLGFFTNNDRPNGIILSPDQKILYLALEGAKKIMAYDLITPGTISNPRTFATGIDPDGLTIDPSGNVYTAGAGNVQAWNPQGQTLFTLSVPEDPTNLDFGGPTGKTLFIASGRSLYSVDLNIATVPEPGTLALGVVTAAGLLMRRRQARHASAAGI